MGCGSAKILHGSGQPAAGGTEDGDDVYGRSSNSKDKVKNKKKGRRFGRSDAADGKFRRSQSHPSFGGVSRPPSGLEDYQTAVAIKGNSRIRVTLSCDGSMLEIETERLSISELAQEVSKSSTNTSNTYQQVIQDLSYNSDSPGTSGQGALIGQGMLSLEMPFGVDSGHRGTGGAPRPCWESTDSSIQSDNAIVCSKCGNNTSLDRTDSIPTLPPYGEAHTFSKSVSCPDKGLNALSHPNSCHCELCAANSSYCEFGLTGKGASFDLNSPDYDSINLDSSDSLSPDFINTKTILLRCSRCGIPIQREKVVRANLPQQHQVTADVEWSRDESAQARSIGKFPGASRGNGEGSRNGIGPLGMTGSKGMRVIRNAKTAPREEPTYVQAFGLDKSTCDLEPKFNQSSLPKRDIRSQRTKSMMVTSTSMPNASISLPNGDISDIPAKPPPRSDSLHCTVKSKPPPVPFDSGTKKPQVYANGHVKEPRPSATKRSSRGRLWLRKAHSENDAEVNFVTLPNGSAAYSNNPAKMFRSLDHGPPNHSNSNYNYDMRRTFSNMSSLSTQETILSCASSASSMSSTSTRKYRRKIGERTKEQIVEVGLMISNPIEHCVDYEMGDKMTLEQDIDECFEEFNDFGYPEAILDALEAQLVEIHVHEDFYNEFSDLCDDEDLDS